VTRNSNLRVTEGLAIDAANDDVANDDWVLSFDLSELGRALPECVRWEELGPLRGFFQGVLFDRDAVRLRNPSASSGPSDDQGVYLLGWASIPTIGATIDGQDATQTGLTLYVIRLK